MNSKEIFKKNINKKRKELDTKSSSLKLFDDLEKEFQNEIEKNPSLKFKKKLSESTKEIKKKLNVADIFPIIEPENITEETILEEEICEIVESEIDFISKVVNSISKEESNKVKEDTNLFDDPNIDTVNPSISAVQKKLKFLEEWVYKISAAGPGSGEVNFRWLDDVNRSTIGNTDQILRYNPSDKKFFFGQLSGDQGPVRSLEFDVNGAGIASAPQMLSWNDQKDCLNIHQADNSNLQVGLENYIRVHNSTANTLTNGTFVQFSGVNGDRETPTCTPFIANSTSLPLYSIGVLTNDIPSGESGRATTLGEVRNLNTTGSDVGETWNVGDLLWASPTIPGKLTKTRPTAPNVIVSVAAVIKSGNTDGILLVRPTIFPRLYYGSFFDTTNQVATANTLNTPITVKYSNTQISSGFSIANTNQIVAHNAGLYNYQFSIQIDSTNAGSSQNMWIWYRKNGQDVASSATRLTVNKEYKVAAWNFIESMEAGNYFELMWATDSIDVKIIAPQATAFCPDIPSVLMTVTQVNL